MTRGLKIPVSAVRFRPWAHIGQLFVGELQPGFELDPIHEAISQSNNSPGQWSLVWEPAPQIEPSTVLDVTASGHIRVFEKCWLQLFNQTIAGGVR